MSLSKEKSTTVRATKAIDAVDTAADARIARLRRAFGMLERVAPRVGSRLAWRMWATPTRPSAKHVARSREGGMGEVRRVSIELPDWTGRRPTGRDGVARRPQTTEILVELLGPADGPLVYLLHGWSGWRGQLAPIGRRLAADGYRVVLIDAPNHGDSGSGALGPKQSLLPDFSLALDGVIREFGPAHAVVGHSLGAACTASVLLDGVKAQRAVFIAPPIDPVAFTRILAGILGFGERIRTRMVGIGERRTGLELASLALPTRLAQVARADLDLPPALVVHDTDDPVVPVASGRVLVEAWPDARIVETKRLGHNKILRNDAVVELVAAFVEGIEGADTRHGCGVGGAVAS